MCAQLMSWLTNSLVLLSTVLVLFVWILDDMFMQLTEPIKVLCSLAVADPDNVVPCSRDMYVHLYSSNAVNMDIESYL